FGPDADEKSDERRTRSHGCDESEMRRRTFRCAGGRYWLRLSGGHYEHGTRLPLRFREKPARSNAEQRGGGSRSNERGGFGFGAENTRGKTRGPDYAIYAAAYRSRRGLYRRSGV